MWKHFVHSRALYKWEVILSQQLLPKPLTTLLLSKSSFWCFKLISFCSVWSGNGCRFLPGAPAAQTEEGRGGHVTPAWIVRSPSRSPRAWPRPSLGAVFSGLSGSNGGGFSGQAGRSPAGSCMNHNCMAHSAGQGGCQRRPEPWPQRSLDYLLPLASWANLDLCPALGEMASSPFLPMGSGNSTLHFLPHRHKRCEERKKYKPSHVLYRILQSKKKKKKKRKNRLKKRLQPSKSLEGEWKPSPKGMMLDPHNQPGPAHVLKQYQAMGPSHLGRIKGGKSKQGLFLRECPFIFLFKHALCRKLENE